jgi:hypothetical protein
MKGFRDKASGFRLRGAHPIGDPVRNSRSEMCPDTPEGTRGPRTPGGHQIGDSQTLMEPLGQPPVLPKEMRVSFEEYDHETSQEGFGCYFGRCYNSRPSLFGRGSLGLARRLVMGRDWTWPCCGALIGGAIAAPSYPYSGTSHQPFHGLCPCQESLASLGYQLVERDRQSGRSLEAPDAWASIS